MILLAILLVWDVQRIELENEFQLEAVRDKKLIITGEMWIEFEMF